MTQNRWRQKKIETKRTRRLMRLLQKREALDRLAEVTKIESWNKRRGKVNSLPFGP